jgi:predicted metal-dependent hydrolase
MTVLIEQSKTPKDINANVRNRVFNFDKINMATDWLDNDPFKTAFFNSLSLGFPIGEKSFIDSVRPFFDEIPDPQLKKEMRIFFGQEGMHRREHNKYNTLLCTARGYNAERIDAQWQRRIEQINAFDNKVKSLAATVAAEHFTAIFAENILRGWQMENVPNDMKALWQWHASEEIEHKSVAFDVFTYAGGSLVMRKKLMIQFTLHYVYDLTRVIIMLLHHDKQLWKWRTLKSAAKFIFGKNGFLRKHWVLYVDFFRKDFHPWNQNNKNLLDSYNFNNN